MTFKASRSARVSPLIGYVGAALIAWVVLGDLLHGVGAVVGAPFAFAIAAIGFKHTRQTRFELNDDAAVVVNLSRTNTLAWKHVARVERRWKYFGLFSPRGEMLCVVPRSGVPQGPIYVYASLRPAKHDRQRMYESLVELSHRFGFEMAADLGPGPFWAATKA